MDKKNSENKNKFIPTIKMIYALLAVFVIGTFFNLSHFPLSKFMSMGALDEGITFEVGWPRVFTSLDLLNSTATPTNWINLGIDVFLLLFVSYLLNVLINYFLEIKIIKRFLGKENIEERSEKPVLLKN
jgi:hypothetical protein